MQIADSIVYNEDCIAGMKRYPDKYFDLAVVDPPYGGGQHFNFRYGNGDKVYKSTRPNKEYFTELFRVSKNQIVWGANYFCHDLPENRCWISWNKKNPAKNFSDFELAWTSFDKVSKCIDIPSFGFLHADKKRGESTIHPTQKPVALYMELFRRYANATDKIIDTHLGSGSSRIAADETGLNFTGFELDKDYFDASELRFKQYKSQLTLSYANS